MGVRVSEITPFVAAGSINIVTSGANATGTLKPSGLYRLVATFAAYIRFGASAATAANGGSDFVLQPGEPVFVRVPSATINALQVAAAGVVNCARIDEESALNG